MGEKKKTIAEGLMLFFYSLYFFFYSAQKKYTCKEDKVSLQKYLLK